MLGAAATNDNGAGRRRSVARTPDRLEAEVRRLQVLAEDARLDGLAFMLAMAAREAGRVAEWESRVRNELDGLKRPPAAA